MEDYPVVIKRAEKIPGRGEIVRREQGGQGRVRVFEFLLHVRDVVVNFARDRARDELPFAEYQIGGLFNRTQRDKSTGIYYQ